MIKPYYAFGIRLFDTIEEAIAAANERGENIIEEYGGNFETWTRCRSCGDFFPESDLNHIGECIYCTQANKYHG